MFVINNILVSEELFIHEFICNLSACKGACCVEGDSGAPLSEEELGKIDDVVDIVKTYLTPQAIHVLEQEGNYTIDTDGDWVTPLINNKECVYTVFDERGTAYCGIEKAYLDKKIDFVKPISCHLYPIRVSTLIDGTIALNYDRWYICSPACKLGQEKQMPVFRFLKNPIIREFGDDFYQQMETVYQEFFLNKTND